MPALERLLSWADVPFEDLSWRAGVARDVGAAGVGTLEPAVVAAWALPAISGSVVTLATPVHLLAGISRVHLSPAGPLRLAEAEARDICESFNDRLGGEEFRLHALADALLLESRSTPFFQEFEAGQAVAQDPALLAGAALSPQMMGRSETLRRLAAETQMLLHDHPVNRARERRGAAPVSLWFWGAGRVQAPPSRLELPPAFAHEAWMSGLWRSQGQALQPPVPAHSRALPQDALVIRFLDTSGETDALDELEHDWFAPLLQSLQEGLPGLRLRLGRRAWNVRRPRLLRWRLRRAWWPQVGA